jgi:hypothetical protein
MACSKPLRTFLPSALLGAGAGVPALGVPIGGLGNIAKRGRTDAGGAFVAEPTASGQR